MNQQSNSPQKQPVPSPSAVKKAAPGRFQMYLGRAQAFLQEFLSRAGRPLDTIYRVAVERHQQGEYADAASRLRLVTRFQPANGEAWYLLGSCELSLGNDEVAATALRKALQLRPQHEEARYLLAVSAPNALPADQQPKFTPLSLATEHFDAAAYGYDEFNLHELGYRGHEECFDSVQKYLNPNYRQFRILDLGCGTGLVGLQFRMVAGHIEGVDISQNMLTQADARRDERESRVYDELHLMDLRHFLLEQPAAQCDIVTAGNVVPFLGGLTPVFDGVAHVLKPGGLFTFSAEPVQGDDFGLIPAQGRFAHSQSYVITQAQRVGLEVLEVRPFEMFSGIEALQYVVRKSAPQAASQAAPAATPATPAASPPPAPPATPPTA